MKAGSNEGTVSAGFSRLSSRSSRCLAAVERGDRQLFYTEGVVTLMQPRLQARCGVPLKNAFACSAVYELLRDLQELPSGLLVFGFNGSQELFTRRSHGAHGHPVALPPDLTLAVSLRRRADKWQESTSTLLSAYNWE